MATILRAQISDTATHWRHQRSWQLRRVDIPHSWSEIRIDGGTLDESQEDTRIKPLHTFGDHLATNSEMGSSREECGDVDSNVFFLRDSRGRQSFLKRLFSKNQQSAKVVIGYEKQLHEIQTLIENNIETLDYLRGISCLEQDFVQLADKVVKTSLQLSHDCRSVSRGARDSSQFAGEVNNSWQHISDLGNILLSHVKHAKRYHLDFLVEAFTSWRRLSQRVHLVSPLHRRMPLCQGLHSGILQISINLPSTNGKPGYLPAGTRVQVRANQPADLLHREWFIVDQEGLVVTSVPAAFVWLESPDPSPERSTNNASAVNGGFRRSRSTSDIPQMVNNFEIVEDLRKQIFEVWEKACSKFDQILREMSISLLKNNSTDSQTLVNTDGSTRFDKALQKISELAEIVEYKDEDGTEKLIQSLEKARLKYKQTSSIGVDIKSADAMVEAINVFEEMVECYRRYGSDKMPELTTTCDEFEKDWVDMTAKTDAASKASADSIKPIVALVQKSPPIIYQEPENVNIPQKRYSKTPEVLKSPKPTNHKPRHRSPILDEQDTDNTCPYSPGSSCKNLQHSISLVSRPSSEEKLATLSHSPARNRRRDRFYRLLPILLRRHVQSRKKKSSKLSDEGESGFSDNDTSHTAPGIHSKIAEMSYDSLTLGRVNYTNRPPLLYSSSGLLNSTDASTIPRRGSSVQSEKHKKMRPLLYSVACQSGVCVGTGITESAQALYEEPVVRKFGKKLQVGKSFIVEKHPTVIQGDLEEKLAAPIESTHVYANIDPSMVFPPRQSKLGTALYDMGVQADFPNRLRSLRCQLVFERPGIEISDKCQVSCDALSLDQVGAERDFRTLNFRLAFDTQSAQGANTF
ncbi:hypothetical protein Aperf_G00000018895 [Anoplocephala perfoliata]